MKKSFKKLITGMLMAGMVMSVAACGKKTDNSAVFDKNTVYKETVMPVNVPDNFSSYNYNVAGDKIFFTAYSYDNKTFESKNYWASINIDGTNLVLNEIEQGAYIDNIIASDTGKVVIGISKYEYENNGTISEETENDADVDVMPLVDSEDNNSDEAEDSDEASDSEDVIDIETGDYPIYYDDYNGANKLYLYVVDGNSSLSNRYNLSDELGIDYIMRTVPLDDKFILIGSDNNIYQFSYDLELLGKKSAGDSLYDFSEIFKISDGTYVARVWGETGVEIKRINLETFETADKLQFPFEISNYSVEAGGKSGYDLLLTSNNQYYGYKMGDAELTPLINFINSDLTASYFDVFAPLDATTFFGVYSEWLEDKRNTYFCKYEKVDPKDIKDKEIISLGCMWMDGSVRTQVVKFNKTHDDVRIVIKDYSVYATEDDYMAGYKQFNADIASGKGPDIVVSSFDENSDAYAKKGLYVDLYHFIDKDSELNRDKFSQNVLEALSMDGKLYFLSPSYYIQTEAGKKSLLGDRTSWTLDEMIQYEKSLPEGTSLFEVNTRESFVSKFVSFNYSFFIDDKNGKCNFNNEEFIKAIEYSKTLPKGDEDFYSTFYDDEYYNNYETNWRNNKVVLMDIYMSSVPDLRYYVKGRFGEAVTFVGYPSVDGSNGSGISFDSAYAISSKSKNKDAAWEFVRAFYTEEAQKDIWNLPVIQSVLEEKAMEATKKNYYLDENGEKVEYDDYYYLNNMEIVMEPFTEEEVNEILAFIASVNKRSSYMSEDISNIIDEEIAPFYNNQKSAEEVANIIQSRVSIMMAEKH